MTSYTMNTISLNRSFVDDKQSEHSEIRLSRSELEITAGKLSADNEEMKMKLKNLESDYFYVENKNMKLAELGSV